jgi:hypothetical protein
MDAIDCTGLSHGSGMDAIEGLSSNKDLVNWRSDASYFVVKQRYVNLQMYEYWRRQKY